MKTPDDFERVMYDLVLGPGKTPDAPTVKQIAGWLNLKEVTVYKKLESELSFTVDEFLTIYRNSRGYFRKALDFIVHECDAELVLNSIVRDGDTDGSFADERDEMSIRIGALTEFLNRAIADNNFDGREKRTALGMLDGLTGVHVVVDTLKRK